MDCLHYKEIISAHVDGTLAAEEELEVQSHLDQCPKCKQFFRWETDVKKLLRQKFSPIVVQPSFKETLLERLEGKRKRRSVRWSYKSEGIVAGLIGAATIAVWFLLLDALNGRPLHTPTVLGTALFRHGTGLDAPDRLSTSAEMVLMYTWVHALVFCVIGVVASKLIVLVERNPEIGFGSFLFFCFFQFGFIIAAFIFAEPVLYILAWPNILGANLLAAGTMAAYFWRRHPKLVIQP
jgi:uncharacterized membrane protein HdeD (DUF308 family)